VKVAYAEAPKKAQQRRIHTGKRAGAHEESHWAAAAAAAFPAAAEFLQEQQQPFEAK